MSEARIGQGKPGPGRPKGSKSRRTIEAEAEMRRMAEAVADSIPNAFRGDALALLVSVYKDTRLSLEMRIDAAKSAIRFERPMLASTEVHATIRRSLADLTDQELVALAGSEGGADGVGETAHGPH